MLNPTFKDQEEIYILRSKVEASMRELGCDAAELEGFEVTIIQQSKARRKDHWKRWLEKGKK